MLLLLFYYIFFFVKIIFIFSCSGMFRNVPACSGMFRVPGFIDGPIQMTVMSKGLLLNSKYIKMGREEGVFKLSSQSYLL